MIPIYFSYFPGAGVKSLITALSLCDGVFYSDKPSMFVQMKYIRGNRTKDFMRSHLLSRSLDTIPATNDRHNWSSYENHNIFKGGDSEPPVAPTETKLLSLVNRYKWFLPVVTHTSSNHDAYRTFFKNGISIKVKPDFNFIDLAIRLKWQPTNQCIIPSFSTAMFSQWEEDVSNIKFDYTIENFNPLDESFYTELEKLALFLDIDVDYTDIKPYIDKYRSFHHTDIAEYPDVQRLTELQHALRITNVRTYANTQIIY